MKKTCLFAILVFTLISACSPPPPPVRTVESLGVAGVSGYDQKRIGINKQQCQFRVVVASHTLGYVGTSTHPIQFQKCLTMRNGDPITVTQVTVKEAGKSVEVTYIGKAETVEFPLR